MARPKKDRLGGGNYTSTILATKKTRKIPYSEIASWMNLTESNLRAMIHLNLNPTAKEWLGFESGLKGYIDKEKERTPILREVPIEKIGLCACGCKRSFIKWAWNKRFKTDECRRKIYKRTRRLKLKELRDTSSCDPTNNSPA